MLDLAWQRLVWEVTLDPFETPDAFTQPSFLRRREVLDGGPRGPFELMLTTRGPGGRPMACLSVEDNLQMIACLSHCHEALAERFAPTDERCDLLFGLHPDPRAVSWQRAPFTAKPYESAREECLRGKRRFMQHHYNQGGWALRIDVSSCGYSLDYRRLLAELPLGRQEARTMLRLLHTLRLAPRHGIRSFGNCLGLLVKTYLHPVVTELDRRGHRFFLTDLDEFHLFAPTRSATLKVAEELEELLRQRGLTLNQGKSRLAPARNEPKLHLDLARVGPFLPRQILKGWLLSDRYTGRGPAFRDLLHHEKMQDAAAVGLGEARCGDRWQILYWLDVANVTPQGRLRKALETHVATSPLEQSLLRGALAPRGEPSQRW